MWCRAVVIRALVLRRLAFRPFRPCLSLGKEEVCVCERERKRECVCAYVRAYVGTCIYTHTHTRTHTLTHAHAHTRTHAQEEEENQGKDKTQRAALVVQDHEPSHLLSPFQTAPRLPLPLPRTHTDKQGGAGRREQSFFQTLVEHVEMEEYREMEM